MKFAQLIIGPAGSGKSSYCRAISEHCSAKKRSVHIVNLDPAAEEFTYPVSLDIRQLISLDDVTEELQMGPNGGLVFCMEYLLENLEWLQDQLGEYEEDYIIIDCPGQIELYSHIPVMSSLTKALDRWGYRLCVVYLLDCNFISDSSKFMSGILSCLSAMIHLELPHINLLTKLDLIDTDTSELSEFLEPDVFRLLSKVNRETDSRYRALTEAMGELINMYSMVAFLPFSTKNIEMIDAALAHIDHCLQYGEDSEPVEPEKWVRESDDLVEKQFEEMIADKEDDQYSPIDAVSAIERAPVMRSAATVDDSKNEDDDDTDNMLIVD